MAFGYEYWMVYLPDVASDTFLLFVHNPKEETKLRDYSSGKCRVVGQPLVESVVEQSGKMCFPFAPHKTTDDYYWYRQTLELNRRHLEKSVPTDPQPDAPDAVAARNRVVSGRAERGSRRQLQDFVNERPDELSSAILSALPSEFDGRDLRVTWVSPLAAEDYREYRDAEFLERVGAGDAAAELAAFWPAQGPSWDALGVLSDPGEQDEPIALILEAKSHRGEIFGSGCQASAASLEKITESLTAAQRWCGATLTPAWTGRLYQAANRIAHLYFFLERIHRPAYLVNVYFTGDPIGPTSKEEWERTIDGIETELGLANPVPNLLNVFLPALGSRERRGMRNAPAPEPPFDGPAGAGINAWVERWMALGAFEGPYLPDPERRIDSVLELWRQPVPDGWHRGIDPQLLGNIRYRRGDAASPSPGEHTLEHDILCRHFEAARCLGGRLVDGINAVPLTTDATGGRRGNVEADLLLLFERNGALETALCEVKGGSSNAWFAAVENLRQLKLFLLSEEARSIMGRRNPGLHLTDDLSVIGLVIAPPDFYSHSGKRANAVSHAVRLLERLSAEAGTEARLAVWDRDAVAIRVI